MRRATFEKIREALEFYADDHSWAAPVTGAYTAAENDDGGLAREALGMLRDDERGKPADYEATHDWSGDYCASCGDSREFGRKRACPII